MPDQIGTVVESRWAEHSGSNRLSFDDFLTQAQEHLLDIEAAQDSMQYAHELFTRQVEIWPDQCDCAIASIAPMSNHIQNFSTLLEEGTHLPVFVAPLRYQLLVTLNYVNEQMSKLKLLLTSFRSICRTSSKQVTKKRYEIQYRLELLVHVGDDIAQKTHILFDQARFLKKEY